MPKMAQTADNWETGCAMAQMRIKDIAAEAGVSPATVSRYLNNRPGQMTEETRARIAAVIERTGYRPRAAARNLRSSRTNLIGVILADIANPFSSAMLEGLSASAAARGCSLMTAISGNDPAKEAESLTRLIDAGVDGLVVNTCGGNDEAIAAAAGRLPVVLLDRDVAAGGVDLVTSNNRELVAGLVDALAAACACSPRQAMTAPCVASAPRPLPTSCRDAALPARLSPWPMAVPLALAAWTRPSAAMRAKDSALSLSTAWSSYA